MLSGMSTKLEEISDGMLRYEKEVLQEIQASSKKRYVDRQKEQERGESGSYHSKIVKKMYCF
jgi:hypothetical protein